MRRNQAVFGAAISPRRPFHHELQHAQQATRNRGLSLVACLVERDEDLVR
jgi:hypothetical protein